MILEISRHNSYCVISCKNKIVASILENNPELFTHKNDTEFHGKGIGILKAIVKKYDGEIKFYEKEGYFYSVAILKLWRLIMTSATIDISTTIIVGIITRISEKLNILNIK